MIEEQRVLAWLALTLSLQFIKESHVAVCGNRWRCLVECLEIDSGEERVCFEHRKRKIRALLAATKSISWIELEELVDDVDHFGLELIWNHKLSLFNLVKDLIVDCSVEGSQTDAHLVNNTAKSPQVHTR